MKLDAKIPDGRIEKKWDNARFQMKLVNPANKRKYRMIVVGSGLAGGAAAASLGELGYKVRFPRHAVAIDEHRDDFEPTLWRPKGTIDLKQVWFAGVHTDVGGGSKPIKDKLLSDIPLAWMAREATNTIGLAFESHLHGTLAGLHAAGKHRSHKGFWRLLGRRDRDIPAEDHVHVSVKRRYETDESYRPKPLKGWLDHHRGWGPLEK